MTTTGVCCAFPEIHRRKLGNLNRLPGALFLGKLTICIHPIDTGHSLEARPSALRLGIYFVRICTLATATVYQVRYNPEQRIARNNKLRLTSSGI